MTLLFNFPPFLSLLIFFFLALFVFFRGPKNAANRLFVWISLLYSLFYLDILHAFNTESRTAALWVSRIDHLFAGFIGPLYLHFFHFYLGIKPPRLLIPLAYGLASFLMCLAVTPWYISGMQRHAFGYFPEAGPLYPIFGLVGFGATVYVSVLVFRVVRREKDAYRKKQLFYILPGLAGTGVLNALNILPMHGVFVNPPGNFAFLPMAVLGWGLFRYDLLKTASFINNSVGYSFLTGLLTCLFALAVTIISKLFSALDFSMSILFSFFFFLMVAIVFGPLRSHIQYFVDRMFFRKKYNFQKTLKSVSQMIVSVLDLEIIGQTLVRAVTEAMQVDACRLVLTPADGSNATGFISPGPVATGDIPNQNCPLFQYLIKERSSVLKRVLDRQLQSRAMCAVSENMTAEGIELAVPLVFKGRFNGCFLLGPKRSGGRFNREDVDLLEALSGQGALAVENARSYKRIDELNHKLEEKVAVRTQALRKALKEKERTQEELIRSESLAAIGQLVAGVAHELNNPLASAASLIQTGMEELGRWAPGEPPDKETLDDLRFAHKELLRAGDIVTSLLGLSRQTDTYTESVAINSVVRDALRVLENQYKHRKYNVREAYGENLPRVRGNFAGLGQVVLNIVQNAFQAMEGSDAVVSLSTNYDRENNTVVFRCIDSGPGIRPGVRKKIFNPFFTTKEPGKGTGLGLYLCHEIVSRHYGELVCDSPPGGGAEFTMILPVENSGERRGDSGEQGGGEQTSGEDADKGATSDRHPVLTGGIGVVLKAKRR